MKQWVTRPTIEEVWNKCAFKVIMGGMGDDTAMMIAECFERGYEPDEIVFCDTGSEFPHTYAFIEYLKWWCAIHEWSKVTVLTKVDRYGEPLSVIDMVERDYTLPAAAFGFKTCSMRFKTEVADKYFNNHPDAWKAWGVSGKGKPVESHTGQILRLVGINADEPNRAARWAPQDKWVQTFPLFDWDIGERESDAVDRVGLYYPGKSSCVCCPHLSGKELIMLRDNYPDQFERIKRIEFAYQLVNMKPDSSTIGLCRGKTIQQKIDSVGKYCSLDDDLCTECK